MKRVIGLIFVALTVILLISGCSAPEQEISPRIIGNWHSEDVISATTIGEINGRTYVFLALISGPIPFKPVIKVLDLSEPSQPEEIASLEAPAEVILPVNALELSGEILYVPIGSSAGNLWAVNVSNPSSPREISFFEEQFGTTGLTVTPDAVYLQGFPPRNLMLVDIGNPTHPETKGEFRLTREQNITSHNQRMAVSGSYLYVVDNDGLDIIDISSPFSPREVGFYANPAQEDEKPGVVENPPAVRTVDINDISDLVSGFRDIAVSGHYAYIPAAGDGLRIIDISSPAAPAEAAKLDIPEAAYRVTICGDLLYLLGIELINKSMSHTMYIMDISEPDNPVIANSLDSLPGLLSYQSVMAAERYVYFTSIDTVSVIDIYSPEED